MSQNIENKEPDSAVKRRPVELVLAAIIIIVLAVMVFLSLNSKDEEVVVNEMSELGVEGVESAEDAPLELESAQVSDLVAEYPGLSDDTAIVRVTSEEALATLNSGTGVVMLGFPACPWCQGLMPVLDQASKNAGLERIEYVDIRQSRQDEDEAYQNLVARLGEFLPMGDDGSPRIFVPDMTVVKDGQVIYRYRSESDLPADERTPDTYWTEERTERVTRELESELAKIL